MSMAISFGTSSRRSILPLTTTMESSAIAVEYSWYVCGKNSTSIAPPRSSSVAVAHWLPCLVTLRVTPDKMPPIFTIWPSPRPDDGATATGRPPSSSSSSSEPPDPISSASGMSASRAMMCSTPSSGRSETYRPSISRSKLSRVFLSHSATPPRHRRRTASPGRSPRFA